jgi:hypothetical protein
VLGRAGLIIGKRAQLELAIVSAVTGQREQVDKNFAAFQALLPTILPHYRDKYALMKDGEAVGFYSTLDDAYMTANQFYRDQPFSVQKVTDTPVDLGFFSHSALMS